jgi:hypothetical protein
MTDQTIADLAAPIGTVRSYEDFHRIIRARVESLDISRATVGEIAGLTAGYANKLLAPRPTKSIGRMAFGVLLGSLGLKLLVVEDAEALARVRGRLVKRGPMPAPGTVHWRQRKKHASGMRPMRMPPLSERGAKWAREMNARRAARLSARRRKTSARIAANARWKEGE